MYYIWLLLSKWIYIINIQTAACGAHGTMDIVNVVFKPNVPRGATHGRGKTTDPVPFPKLVVLQVNTCVPSLCSTFLLGSPKGRWVVPATLSVKRCDLPQAFLWSSSTHLCAYNFITYLLIIIHVFVRDLFKSVFSALTKQVAQKMM